MPKVDWSDGEHAPLPEGKYILKVERVNASFTRAGAERWQIIYSVLAPEEYVGVDFADSVVFTEAAMWYAKMLLGAMFPEDKKAGKVVEYSEDDIIGKVIEADVIVTERGGEKWNRVKQARPVSDDFELPAEEVKQESDDEEDIL